MSESSFQKPQRASQIHNLCCLTLRTASVWTPARLCLPFCYMFLLGCSFYRHPALTSPPMDCFMCILTAFVFAPMLNVGRKTLPLLFLVCLHLPFHVVRDYLIWIPLQEESISAQVGRAPYFPVFLSIPSSSEGTSRNMARCSWLPGSKNVWWKLSIRAAEMGLPMWQRHKGTDTTRITGNKQQKTPVTVDKTQPISTQPHRLLLVIYNSYIVSYCSVAFFRFILWHY